MSWYLWKFGRFAWAHNHERRVYVVDGVWLPLVGRLMFLHRTTNQNGYAD